jgi:heme-degrading monooxygenase HmoA
MAMIKIMVERHVKQGQEISQLLRQIRAAALTSYGGFISGETLIDIEDSSVIVTISTWHKLEDWERWAASDTRAKMYQKIEPFLVEKPKVRRFQIAVTEHKAET